jgi:hypothetical protein
MVNVKSFGPTDGVADTKTQIGSTVNLSFKKIHGFYFCGTNVVSAKANSAIISFEIEGVAGPNEIPVEFGLNTLTTSGGAGAPSGYCYVAHEIIGVKPTSELKIYVTCSEAIKDIIVGIVYS